jgi:acetyl esterase
MPKSTVTPRERAEYRISRALSLLPHRAQVRLSGKPAVRVGDQVLHPEIQLTLSLLERRGDPPMETLSPVMARKLTRRQAEVFSGAPVAVGAVRDLTVPGPAGPLPARLYSPDEPGAGKHPLLVFLAGGGFVIGDLETHDVPCRILCRHAGVHVLAVEYRKAPEDPFPAAVEDATAALRWALEHAGELGADPTRVAIGGDSAGGNLSAVACQELKRAGGPQAAAQLLIYPTVEAGRTSGSIAEFDDGYFLTGPQMQWFAHQYLGDDYDPVDPRISPLRSDDLSGLPPAILVTAGFDPLRDEGEEYAAALRAAGVPVVQRRFGGLIHGFINMTSVGRVAHDSLVEMAGGLRALLATLGVGGSPGDIARDSADAVGAAD